METTSMIPNLTATETPGRGGSDLSAAGGPGGASGGQPKEFTQRAFTHGETELASVTGLATKALQKIRQKKLRQGEHWEIAENLRVAYSEPGVIALLQIATGTRVTDGKIAGVALAELLVKTCLAPRQGTQPPAEQVTGKVCRLFPNPYLVEIDLGNRKVLIRVKENKNLRRGMEVPLKAGKGPSGLQLARRLPRFPGKW